MSAAALCRIEKNKQELRAEEAERIATALGITMPQFYGEIAARSQDPAA